MININVSNDLISGSYGKEQFVVKFSKERYDAMVVLKKQADAATKIEELKEIYNQFESLTKQSYKELIETKCPYIVVNEMTKEFFLKNDDVVSSIAMPEVFAKRIIESAEKDVDFMPLIKLWMRFLRNPILRGENKNGRIEFAERFANYINTDFVNQEKVNKLIDDEGIAEDIAIKLASVKDVAVTQEGMLCTYKVVDEITTKWTLDENGNKKLIDRYKKEIDENTGLIKTIQPETNEERLFEPHVMRQNGDAYFVEGANGFSEPVHFVRIGCRHRLPDWSHVNCNSEVSCVKGLHTGGLSYVHGYQTSGSETLNVFIDPMMIGAIADGDGALRVLEYFAHGAWSGTNGNLYHSSTYAAMTDEEWAKMRKEVVEFFAKENQEQHDEITEINAL